MKTLGIYFAAGAALTIGSAQAGDLPHTGWTFGASQKLSTVVNTDAPEGCPIETADGLSLMFASNRPINLGGMGGNDIYVTDRDSLGSPWKTPVRLPAPINSASADFCPTPVYGRSLFFVTDRPTNNGPAAPCGGGDMYLSRQSPGGEWSDPVMLDCYPNGPNFSSNAAAGVLGAERSPSLVETWFGTFLFYSSTGLGANHDIYMSRLGTNGKFGPGALVKDLSTPEFNEIMPNVRARDDGSFEIVYSSDRPTWGKNNEPAFGLQDAYYSRSWWLTGFWSPPRNLGAGINTQFIDQRTTLSRDGKRFYVGTNNDLYVSDRK
jgi:WD40-like Beta Propeller Repeat